MKNKLFAILRPFYQLGILVLSLILCGQGLKVGPEI